MVIRPRALLRGATIGICAPAGPVERDVLERELAALEAQGFRLRIAPHVHAREAFLAGSDDDRLTDLTALLRDPDVGAILAARGGWGVGRILARLDPAEWREKRKLVIGYSDITSLQIFLLQHAGLASIHGPMLQRDDTPPEARERLFALASGEAPGIEPLVGRAMQGGEAEGRLVGGNLTVVCSTLGTPFEIDTRGAVLFLEDIAAQPYAIDRHLRQLRAAGKLDDLVAVALGQFVNCESWKYPEMAACDVLRENLAEVVRGPVVYDLPFGHVADNRALPYGTRARVSAAGASDEGRLELLEAVVEESI